jgi:hypothetical protein
MGALFQDRLADWPSDVGYDSDSDSKNTSAEREQPFREDLSPEAEE